MKSSLLALLLLTSLSVGPRVPAQVSAEGEGYRFRLKYVKGEKTRYAATTEMTITGAEEGMPEPPKAEATVEQEVLSVEDGVATVKITTTGGPEGSEGEQTVKIDEKGKVVGDASSPTAGPLAAFPDRPVKAGEEWSAEVDMPNAPEGSGKMKMDYKFVGMVKEEDVTLAQVDMKATLAGPMMSEGTGTVMLDPASGQLVSMKLENKMTMTIPGADRTITVTMNMTMKRLPPASR